MVIALCISLRPNYYKYHTIHAAVFLIKGTVGELFNFLVSRKHIYCNWTGTDFNNYCMIWNAPNWFRFICLLRYIICRPRCPVCNPSGSIPYPSIRSPGGSITHPGTVSPSGGSSIPYPGTRSPRLNSSKADIETWTALMSDSKLENYLVWFCGEFMSLKWRRLCGNAHFKN